MGRLNTQIRYLNHRLEVVNKRNILKDLDKYELAGMKSELNMIKSIQKDLQETATIKNKIKTLSKHINEFLDE